MNLWDLCKMGLRNLSRRKARTALTIVGVVIGTVSIVAMVSVGIGMNRAFEHTYMENGTMTVIRIEKYGSIIDKDGNWQGEKEQVLNDDLVKQLRNIEHIKAIAPTLNITGTLTCGKYTSWCNVKVTDCDAYAEFGYPDLVYGTYPTHDDYRKFVFAYYPLQQFSYSSGRKWEQKTVDPTAEAVTFKFSEWEYQRSERKKEFVYEMNPKKGNFAVMGESDNFEYSYYCTMDMTFFKEIWTEYCSTLKVQDRKKAMQKLDSYETIFVNVDNISNVSKVQEEIEALGFITYSDMMYLEPLQETSNMIELVLGAIGALAMLVSAINIANTMVMSIYERTREIGIMKVLGCRVADIRRLFLYEAALIGLMGGIIGIALSYLVSFGINKYGTNLFQTIMQTSAVYDVEGAKFSVIPIWLPFLAALFAMMVGVISGYIPARRATKISAIEAMKANQ